MDPILDVRNLQTHFFTKAGVLKAVDGVSFQIGAGEIVGLVGESGSGKSITGFSILGLVDAPGRIVGGEILFSGRDLTKLPPAEIQKMRGSRIAMIFQDPMMTLNPVLRIETQMTEAIQTHDSSVSKDEARQRSRDAMGMCGNGDGAIPPPLRGGLGGPPPILVHFWVHFPWFFLDLPWFSSGFPWFFHGVPWVFPGFSMVFPGFSIVVLGFSLGFPWIFHRFPWVFPATAMAAIKGNNSQMNQSCNVISRKL